MWDFGVLGHLCSQNDVITSWLRLTATSNCFLHPYQTYTKYLSTLICCPWAYGSSLKYLYPHYLAIFWGSGSLVESKWCHYIMVDWQPPQTASCIHIIHIQSVWTHWYAVHGHMAVVSNTYTHTTWVRFWGSGSLLVESKWCHYIMVEAESHLKLLPASTLYTYKVFEHIDMLSMGIWQ